MDDGDGSAQLHARFKSLLQSAESHSCQIVGTFLDVRGFSTFTASGMAFDPAIYLGSIFRTILESYFADASFYKSTGDGLLLVHDLPQSVELAAGVVSGVLRRSIALVEAFQTITSDDIRINFDVPTNLGIGMARGRVTQLVAAGQILDYTGPCLNLAARLMEKARPCGVIFADQHAERLLEDDVAPRFSGDRLWIRGVSGSNSLPVLVTSNVRIQPIDREPPPNSERTYGEATELDLAYVRTHRGYNFFLPRRPVVGERVGVYVEWPASDGEDAVGWTVEYGAVEDHPDGSTVTIDFTRVSQLAREVPDRTEKTTLLGNRRVVATKVKFTAFCEPSKSRSRRRRGK